MRAILTFPQFDPCLYKVDSDKLVRVQKSIRPLTFRKSAWPILPWEFSSVENRYCHLPRDTNQAMGLARYAIDFLAGDGLTKGNVVAAVAPRLAPAMKRLAGFE